MAGILPDQTAHFEGVGGDNTMSNTTESCGFGQDALYDRLHCIFVYPLFSKDNTTD